MVTGPVGAHVDHCTASSAYSKEPDTLHPSLALRLPRRTTATPHHFAGVLPWLMKSMTVVLTAELDIECEKPFGNNAAAYK